MVWEGGDEGNLGPHTPHQYRDGSFGGKSRQFNLTNLCGSFIEKAQAWGKAFLAVKNIKDEQGMPQLHCRRRNPDD